MAPEAQQPHSNALAPPTPDAAAIGKLVRDELDRNNRYFEFAQGQIEKGLYSRIYG
jgi:hypothetical protein